VFLYKLCLRPAAAHGFTFNWELVMTVWQRKKTALVCIIAVSLVSSSAGAVMMETVPVGNPGNLADTRYDTTGFGSVAYNYSIGMTEVTNAQYVEFLNSVDPMGANTLALYNSNMSSDASGGINFNGVAPNGSKYEIKAGRDNNPVVYVSFYDSIRFANWLHSGMGSGDTENGAYTLLGGTPIPSNGNSITRSPDAKWFLPSEDEWYKAAYHKNDGVSSNYWDYPTSTDSVPYSDQPPGSGAPNPSNTANFRKDDGIANGYDDGYAVTGSTSFSSAQNYLTDVAAYALSTSAYGTFDQGGNAKEWIELLRLNDDASLLGGGSWLYDSASLRASSRNGALRTFEVRDSGFRVASIPEPATFGLASVAVALTAIRRRSRRPNHLSVPQLAAAAMTLASVAAAFSPAPAYAAGYTFTNIADNAFGSLYTAFYTDPAISGNHVAFNANSIGGNGIFVHDLTTGGIAYSVLSGTPAGAPGGEPGYVFQAIIGPSTSDNRLAFWASYCRPGPTGICEIGTNGEGIYMDIEPVAWKGDPAPSGSFSSFRYPAISGLNVGYIAAFGSNEAGVFIDDFNIVKTGDPAPVGTFTGFYGDKQTEGPAISGDTVAFGAWYSDGVFAGEGIFAGRIAEPLTTIAKQGDIAPSGRFLSDLRQPSISGNSVAFNGSGSGGSGIYVGSGGPLTTIVESNDPAPEGVFSHTGFRHPVIAGETVAFQGFYGPTPLQPTFTGIFTGSGGDVTTVIKTGDPLFGSTIAEGSINYLYLGRFGFDPEGTGKIVFYYELADGRKGIALATPIPDPDGDFNDDGTIDAADYVAWRNGFATGAYTQDDYNTWRANFGAPAAGAAAVAQSASPMPVPEPAMLVWAAIAVASACRWRFSKHRNSREFIRISRILTKSHGFPDGFGGYLTV
jgi:formylglycine-generating enzyme required for sulfatase activity